MLLDWRVAVEDDPQLIGCLPLLRMANSGVDLQVLAGRLLERASRNDRAAEALMDLAWLFLITGKEEIACSTQALALKLRQLYRLSTGSSDRSLRLLVIMTPGDYLANTPVECLLEGADVTLDVLFLGPGLPFPEPWPGHDVIFMAFRGTEEHRPLIQQLEERLTRQPRPVVNAPGRLPLLARDELSALLASVPGVLVPPTGRIDRPGLLALATQEAAFPILVRPLGSHRGQDLAKLDDGPAVRQYLASTPGEAFFLSRFIDYRSQDGMFRKVRIVLIGGHPYAVHLAISGHWMVNYINAHMEESLEKRAEEADFLARFEKGFGLRHATALQAIHDRLGLDYVVSDCAELPDGRLLLFEADNAAMVHSNDHAEVFPYKQAQMQKVFAAFRGLLSRAAVGG